MTICLRETDKNKGAVPEAIRRRQDDNQEAGARMHHQNLILSRLCRTAGIAAASLGLLALTALPGDAAGRPTSDAHAAKVTSLNEVGSLHLVSKHGFTLNEQGTTQGTVKGTITVRLKIVSTSRVTAEITISPNGGSVSGYGTASYHKGQTSASFSGSMSVNRGSGSYSHAQGSGLSFSGTIARSNDAITVHVNGRISS